MSKKRQSYSFGLLIATAALLLSACIAPIEPVPTDSSEQVTETVDTSALTVEQLGNATYSGIYEEPVTLSEGLYEGEPFVEGGASRPTVQLIVETILYGDLNADGVDDAAMMLVENSGGSGVFNYIGAQLNQDGQPVDAGTILLGDRTQIQSAAIEDGQIVINMVTQGPEDAMCCPTLKLRTSYSVQDGALAEVGSQEMGTVSLDDLMGTNWVLTELAPDQPLVPDTEITASFVDGTLTGSAGCNNYNAAVSSDGGQTLTVGPAASTMMACPDPIMTQEIAYLTALQGATQWGYVTGQLVISYMGEDGSFGTFYFASADGETEGGTNEESGSNVIDVTYACADDVTIEAVFDNDTRTATVTLPEGTLDLPQVEAASGARYSDGTTTFWTKGDEAFVMVDDETVISDCLAQ
jgi:membrane-bound inhibitor of C-type lysozyme/heat shock protein HslJ